VARPGTLVKKRLNNITNRWSFTMSKSSPSTMFHIAPGIDTETLLAHACESLKSANVMASDFATFVDGPQRSMLLGIQQVIMLAEMAVIARWIISTRRSNR
jgi:hypothetical protein